MSKRWLCCVDARLYFPYRLQGYVRANSRSPKSLQSKTLQFVGVAWQRHGMSRPLSEGDMAEASALLDCDYGNAAATTGRWQQQQVVEPNTRQIGGAGRRGGGVAAPRGEGGVETSGPGCGVVGWGRR